MVVQRITMFRMNDEADIQKMIDQYKIVAETNKKVGSCYTSPLIMSNADSYKNRTENRTSSHAKRTSRSMTLAPKATTLSLTPRSRIRRI